MPGNPQLIYWDSCVFLTYINADPTRIDVLDVILHEIRVSNGAKKIVTSIIAKVEVAGSGMEGTTNRLSLDIEQKIDALWNDDSVIGLIELHDAIAMRARELMRKARAQAWSLKPPDAIHLASAQWLGVEEFQTYDERLYKYSTLVGCTICEPYTSQPTLGF